MVSVDGSNEGIAGLALARSLAGTEDRIVAVHSWEIPVVGAYEGVVAVDPAQLQSDGQRFLDELLATDPDDRISGELVGGNPGQAAVDVADQHDADVIVVPMHSSSKLGAILGSDAHHVLHSTDRPVIVVRGELRTPIRTVAVGVDDPADERDETSADALGWALALTGPERIEVHHAAFVPGVAAGPVREAPYESPAEIAVLEAQLRAAIDAVVGDGPPPEAEVVPIISGGTGAFCMIERSREVDLVVVGSRGRSGFMELLTGSTTLEVVTHAHCPVAVIH